MRVQRVSSRPRWRWSTTTTERYQCHKLGHLARECFQDGAAGGCRGGDLGSRGVLRGGGGRGGRMNYTPHIKEKCYKCNRIGHFTRDCKEDTNRCYGCNGTGHISKDCQHRSEERSCYNCAKMAHIARLSKEQEKTCYICHKQCHIYRDCKEGERRSGASMSLQCYLCSTLHSFLRDLTNRHRNYRTRYICGHMGVHQAHEAGSNYPFADVCDRWNDREHIAHNVRHVR
ncbi:uncharacterized protein LOC144177976 [Haemaphysalis longicornis]